jgi:hypothetical protein
VRGGIDGGAKGGGRNTRWQREEVESMLMHQRWGDGVHDGDGVRAELLAQKELYEMECHGWRRPLLRLVTIVSTTWGGWRRRLWRH